MSNDKSRESFKEWAMTTGFEDHHFTVRDDGEFKDYDVRLLWGPWQASRESLVIELPHEDDTRCDTVAEIAKQESYNLALGECCQAVKSAGLKVKP